MIFADTFAALVTAVVLGMWVVGNLEPLHLIAGGAVVSFFSAFQAPAYAAAVPDLVNDDVLDRANGMIQLGPALAIVVGPATASVVFSWTGIGALLLVDLVTFSIGVGTLLVVNFQSRAGVAEDDDKSLRSATTWLRRAGRPLAALIGLAAAANFALGSYNVVILGLASQLGGEARAGWPATSGGIAMIVGSVVIGSLGLPERRITAIGLAAIWFGMFTVSAVLRPSLWLLVACIGVSYAAVPVLQAAMNTIFQEHVPASMLGRVFGLRSAVGMAAFPLGALVAGPLAAWSETGTVVGVGLSLTALGVLVLSGAGFGALARDSSPNPS